MILEINQTKIENLQLLEKFITSMGDSSDSFRYYKSRPISVINNHICTVVLLSDNDPIAYGHLDKEKNDVWLGIAVSQMYRGQGKGDLILKYLIDKADELKVEEIKLSVDKNNLQAIKLYVKYGFAKFFEKNEILFFSRKLSA